MQSQSGFLSVGVLIAILVGLTVFSACAYYFLNQHSVSSNILWNSVQQTQFVANNLKSTPTQSISIQELPSIASKITITAPVKGDVLKIGNIYKVKWTGQSNSDRTIVTLKATDPNCLDAVLFSDGGDDGERGCSAIELGKVKLSSGSFDLDLRPGASLLSQLGYRDTKAIYILFLVISNERVVGQEFTIQGNDFMIIPSIGKTVFASGETIRFSIHGITDTGETISPELGFSAKVFLEWGNNWGPEGSAIYREGLFNQVTKQWDFVTTAPITSKNWSNYRIFLYVECSDQVLCAQRYPNHLEKSSLLKFNVIN